MSHMMRIMEENLRADLLKVAEESDSILLKVAMGLNSVSEILPIMQYLKDVNPESLSRLKDLFSQLVERQILAKISDLEAESAVKPFEIERDRLSALSNLLDARMRASKTQQELNELRNEMAAKLGPMMQQNPAMQAVAQQMPAPVAPGAPGPAPAALPGPGAAPLAPAGPPPGLGAGAPPAGPAVPESPMEAAT